MGLHTPKQLPGLVDLTLSRVSLSDFAGDLVRGDLALVQRVDQALIAQDVALHMGDNGDSQSYS